MGLVLLVGETEVLEKKKHSAKSYLLVSQKHLLFPIFEKNDQIYNLKISCQKISNKNNLC
jgi:hypothetical protein